MRGSVATEWHSCDESGKLSMLVQARDNKCPVDVELLDEEVSEFSRLASQVPGLFPVFVPTTDAAGQSCVAAGAVCKELLPYYPRRPAKWWHSGEMPASDRASRQKRNTVRIKPDFPLGGWMPSAPAAEPNPFKHYTKDYKGYTIEVKQDFGNSYAMIDGMPCNFGYIVTKDGQNALPGGGWTPTVADAQLAIDCLIASEGDFSKFHQLFQAVKQASTARGLVVLTGEFPPPTEAELAMAARVQHYKASPARFCTGTEPQNAGAMYVIRYRADGSFNYGPPNTNVNGFPVRLDEATRYASRDSAQQKASDLGDVEIMTYAEAVAATSLTAIVETLKGNCLG